MLPPRAVAAAAGAASSDSDRRRLTRGSLANRCEIFVSVRPAQHRSPLAATSVAREPVRRPRLAELEAASKLAARLSAGRVAADLFIGRLNLSKSLAQRVWASDAGVYAVLVAELCCFSFAKRGSPAWLEASTGALRGYERLHSTSRPLPL